MFSEKNKSVTDTMNGIQLDDNEPSIGLYKNCDALAKLGTIHVEGFLITSGEKSKYGNKSVLVVMRERVDGVTGKGEPVKGARILYLPEWCVKDFESFTIEELTAIREGHLALTNFAYKDTRNGRTAIFEYADC